MRGGGGYRGGGARSGGYSRPSGHAVHRSPSMSRAAPSRSAARPSRPVAAQARPATRPAAGTRNPAGMARGPGAANARGRMATPPSGRAAFQSAQSYQRPSRSELGNFLNLPAQSSLPVTIDKNTAFILTAFNEDKSASKTVQVEVLEVTL